MTEPTGRSALVTGRRQSRIPADVGHAVAFLASDPGNDVTGSALTVDGGFNA